jgi:hypothetical protein
MDNSEREKIKQGAIQCWLEEHRALRAVIEIHFTTMRYLVIFNITALGTIGGLILSDIENNIWLALIIPILSPFIGFLVFFYSRQITQLGHYIREKIAPRLQTLVKDKEVIGWESYVRSEEEKVNKFVRWFSISGMSILTFTLPSVFVLIFTAKQTFSDGTSWQISLWLIGLLLTIVLVLVFIIERELWFGKETTPRKIWKRLRGITKKQADNVKS